MLFLPVALLDAISEKKNENDSSVHSSSTSHCFDEVNYISNVLEYCQQNKMSSPNFIQVKREGPSHNPVFYYKVVIDKQDYPEAQGKTAKEAKQKAAQLALSVINEQLSQDSNLSDSFVSSEESQHLTQNNPSSSGGSWIQFEDSKSSNSQTSNSLDDIMEKSSGDDPPVASTYSRIHSEYDCVKALGSGAFGYVYKARNKRMNKNFAIKEIKTKEPEKALQEAKVLVDLLHPNIVRYYTSWSENAGYRCPSVNSDSEFLFIEMELCDGGNLRKWICEKNIEPLQTSRRNESLKIALQILCGVEYIHGKKLIHRDLKPENILFGQDGNVRIGDFGLVTEDNDEGEVLERTGDRGTPNYMAPEQVGVNYDRKVDIFALGLIFFELLWRMATSHEKFEIWKGVRQQKFPMEFTGTYVIESHVLKTMLSQKPEARPEACALKSELEKWNTEGNPDQGNQTI